MTYDEMLALAKENGLTNVAIKKEELIKLLVENKLLVVTEEKKDDIETIKKTVEAALDDGIITKEESDDISDAAEDAEITGKDVVEPEDITEDDAPKEKTTSEIICRDNEETKSYLKDLGAKEITFGHYAVKYTLGKKNYCNSYGRGIK